MTAAFRGTSGDEPSAPPLDPHWNLGGGNAPGSAVLWPAPADGPAKLVAAMSETRREKEATRVLVVDDDPGMQRTVSEYLEREGLQVIVAGSSHDASARLGAVDIGLVILDLRLGQEDGLDLLRRLRSSSDIPVIIVTGYRRDEVDRIVGLELGADDYITKPFSLRELLARIRTVLRRVDIVRAEQARPAAPSRVSFDGWTLDRRARRLTDPRGTLVSLTKGEFALLSALIEAPGRPLSREFLMQATRVHEDVYDRSIDVQILRLRRKLERDPSEPRIIRTERGFGYTFALPVETSR